MYASVPPALFPIFTIENELFKENEKKEGGFGEFGSAPSVFEVWS